MLRKFFFHIFLFAKYKICKIKTRGNSCTYKCKIGIWKYINQFIKISIYIYEYIYYYIVHTTIFFTKNFTSKPSIWWKNLNWWIIGEYFFWISSIFIYAMISYFWTLKKIMVRNSKVIGNEQKSFCKDLPDESKQFQSAV